MKKKRETVVVIVALLFSFVFCGCMQESENKFAAPEEKTGAAASAGKDPALPHDLVDARIGMYEKFLERKDITKKDRETVQSLLSNCRKIRKTLDNPVTEEYYREITHILFDIMIMLDEGYLLSSAPEIKTEIAKPEERSGEMPRREGVVSTALPVDLLDHKISMLEDYSGLKNISDADRETAHLLLKDYMRMRTANTGDMSDMDEYYREISHLLFDTVIMLEEKYFFKEKDEASAG